jgi:hypothetical protein
MPRYKSYNMLIQRFSRAGREEGLLSEVIFIVKSRWRGPYNKLGGSKYTQPQYIGDLRASALRNNIRGRQNAETADIAGDASSIALVSTKQLVDTRSGRRLSPSSSIVRLPKELIVPTLRPKKRLTNA